MKLRFLLLGLALFCAGSLPAAPPSDDSIRELLRLSKAEQLIAAMLPQIEAMQKAAMQEATKGRSLPPGADASLEKVRRRSMELVKEELSWPKLESLYFEVYRDSFTQEELDGLIAFYKTPAGQAMINKMPTVMQKTMTAMQGRMGAMMQRMQTIIREGVEDAMKPPAPTPKKS